MVLADRQFVPVVRRMLVGTYNDGFTHAGNLAYLALIALFPFFITATAVAAALGRSETGMATVDAVLAAMPATVSGALRDPIVQAMGARRGGLLVFGAAVSLWTVASLIEAIRDILHRAYRAVPSRSFWLYRLGGMALTVGAVLLLMLSLGAEVLLVAAEQFVRDLAPGLGDGVLIGGVTRWLPFFGLYLALYILFRVLTPAAYKAACYPKWPGAALTAGWWIGTLAGLPLVLAYAFSYDLTYGSLAGVMITLLFFYIVGLGLVMGAELNAALAAALDDQLATTGKGGE